MTSSKVHNDENGVLEEHVERRHDRRLYLLHIATHTGNDVALSLLTEESERELVDLLVELVAYVSHHARANGYDGSRRKEVGSRLEERHERQRQSDEEQRGGGSHRGDEVVDIIVHVVHQGILVERPRHEARRRVGVACLKQDLQHGDECCEREDVEHCRQYVEQHR